MATMIETASEREARIAYQDAIAASARQNADEVRRLVRMSGADFAAHCAALGVNPKARGAIEQCAQITHPHRRY